MKKAKTYKIMAAFSSFLLAAICLTASTFAWFSLSDDLVVDNIKIGLKSTQYIQIGLYSDDASLKAKYGDELGQWDNDIFYVDPEKGTVTTEMLADFGQYDAETLFEPLSNVYNSEYMAGGTDGYLPVLTKMPSPRDVQGQRMALRNEKSYLQIECYIRTIVEDVYVFIDPVTDITPDIVKNANKANEKGIPQEYLDEVVNYTRMSFYSYDERYDSQFYTIFEPHTSNYDYQKTAYFGRLDIEPTDGYYDFSYETMNETIYGAYSGSPVYSENGRADAIPTHYDGFNATSYPSVHPFSLEESLEGNFVGRYEDTLTPSDIRDGGYHSTNGNSLGFVPHGTPARYVITCWLEGWDLDCSTYSSEASFEINIGLVSESAKRYTAGF